MNELLLLIARNGLLLLGGATLLLSLGCGVVLLCKSPVHRQRVSELTIAGVLVWMVLALLPLPRLLPESWSEKPAALERTLPWALVPETREEASVPIVTQWVGDNPVAEPDDITPQVEPPFEAALEPGSLGGPSYGAMQPLPLGNEPSYAPSPSEEIAARPLPIPLSPSTTAAEPAASIWQFDSQKLAGLVTGAYLAGASLCLFWILAGSILLLRIRRQGETPPEWLANQYQSLARQTSIASPRLIISRLCNRPLTWGLFWPVIVLPRSLCRQENKSQLRTILLHELGHIAQQDSQGNVLFCLALPLLYVHPLYWWLRRESQLAAELVADDWAAWQTGKETYVEELVALARCTGTSSLPLVGVTGLFSSPSQFYRRMQMLIAREKPLSTKTSLFWRLASLSALAGSVALAASLAGVRPVAGQTEPPPAVAPPATTPAPQLTPQDDSSPMEPPAVGKPELTLPDAPKAASNVPATPAPAAPSGANTPAAVPLPVPAPPTAAPPVRFVPRIITVPTIEQVPLGPEEAALLAEIKLLQDKLRALESQKNAQHATGSQPPAVAVPPGTTTIQLARPDASGVIWSEVWSVDEKGRPSKIISRFQHSNKESQPKVVVSRDGRSLTEEIVDQDGNRRTLIMDSKTGKILAETRQSLSRPKGNRDPDDVLPTDTKPGKPIVSPRVEDPNRLVPGTDNVPLGVLKAQRPVAEAAPPADNPTGILAAEAAGNPNLARNAQQLDLVSLAISYADAISVRESAAAKMADIERLYTSKAISQQEVTVSKLALSAAERKEGLLRSIAQVALDSAVEEAEMTMKLVQTGNAPASAAGEAKTRLAILKQILGTNK